jgi:EmrB/QacA subfamily drug resistance transporter
MTISSNARDRAALAGVCLASLMFGLEISSIPVILPILESTLPADFRALQWIMNAYTIACTAVLMATGTLADRFGRKRVFIATTAAFGLTSLVCGLAPNAPILIAGRFLQGMAGGAMLTCAIAIISHQFPDGRERGRAFTLWGVISGVGLGFGPVVGSMLTALAGWQWVFLVHVPLTVLALVPAAIGIRESSDSEAKELDLAGIVTLTLAVFGFAFVITQATELGLVMALALAGLSLVSFIAFLFVEKRAPQPMFDFSVFRIRRFSGAIIGCAAMNFSYWPFIIYLPIYFQSGLGLGAEATGLLLLAYTVPFMVMPAISDHLLLRHGPQVVVPLGMLTMGAGFIAMWFGSSVAEPGWLTVLPGALLAGIGLGLTNTAVTNTTTGSVPSNRAGMASGIDISARLIALAINIPVMGLILVEGIRRSLPAGLSGVLDPSQLQALATSVAAGNLGALPQGYAVLATHDPSGAGVHAALVQGFGWVMLYGGISAGVLAAISLLIFGGFRLRAEGGAVVACVASAEPEG